MNAQDQTTRGASQAAGAQPHQPGTSAPQPPQPRPYQQSAQQQPNQRAGQADPMPPQADEYQQRYQQSSDSQQAGAYQQAPNSQQTGAYQQASGSRPQSPNTAASPNAYYTATGYVATKDHVAAGLLAIFLGALGIHKFYLGYNTAGFIMLGVSVLGSLVTLGIAGGVTVVLGLVEGIIYLTKTQTEFDREYVYNKKEWF